MSNPATQQAPDGIDEAVAMFRSDRAELLKLLVEAALSRVNCPPWRRRPGWPVITEGGSI